MLAHRWSLIAVVSASTMAASAHGQPVQWPAADGGNGHWYQVIDTSLFWSDARDAAVAMGGHLATFSSANELVFVRPLLPAAQAAGDVWIGASRASPSSPWLWVNGEPFVFVQWQPGQPDDGPESLFLELIARPEILGFGLMADEAHYAWGGGQHLLVEWDADCNGDGVVDKGQILSGQLADLNSNGIPDECEMPCVVTAQPQPQVLRPGDNAAFSISFARISHSYQWRRNGADLTDSARIAGATTPTLTISAITGADQGSYACIIAGSCGTITSNAVPLSCTAVIAQQPEGGTWVSGQAATLSAVLASGGTMTMRWRKDGINLFNNPNYSGVTTATLTINTTDPTQSGVYTLAITNSCGTTTSSGAIVQVYCRADLNQDGNVDPDDLIDYITCFFTPGCAAVDFNADGNADPDDLADFITAFFAGC